MNATQALPNARCSASPSVRRARNLSASVLQFRMDASLSTRTLIQGPGHSHHLAEILTRSAMMSKSTAGREDLGLEDLRSAISAFIQERDWEQFHSPKNLAMALSVEVAELVEHFQWLTEEDSKNLPPE